MAANDLFTGVIAAAQCGRPGSLRHGQLKATWAEIAFWDRQLPMATA